MPDPTVGSTGSQHFCNPSHVFVSFLCSLVPDPTVGSIGSHHPSHVFVSFLCSLVPDPTVGSTGSYHFCNPFHVFGHFRCSPRSLFIILKLARGTAHRSGSGARSRILEGGGCAPRAPVPLRIARHFAWPGHAMRHASIYRAAPLKTAPS